MTKNQQEAINWKVVWKKYHFFDCLVMQHTFSQLKKAKNLKRIYVDSMLKNIFAQCIAAGSLNGNWMPG